LVGDQLCWSYPSDSIIHILDVKNIHKVKEEKSSGILNLISSMTDKMTLPSGLNNFRSKMTLKADDKDDDFKRVDSKKLIPIVESANSLMSESGGEDEEKRGSYQPPSLTTSALPKSQMISTGLSLSSTLRQVCID